MSKYDDDSDTLSIGAEERLLKCPPSKLSKHERELRRKIQNRRAARNSRKNKQMMVEKLQDEQVNLMCLRAHNEALRHQLRCAGITPVSLNSELTQTFVDKLCGRVNSTIVKSRLTDESLFQIEDDTSDVTTEASHETDTQMRLGHSPSYSLDEASVASGVSDSPSGDSLPATPIHSSFMPPSSTLRRPLHTLSPNSMPQRVSATEEAARLISSHVSTASPYSSSSGLTKPGSTSVSQPPTISTVMQPASQPQQQLQQQVTTMMPVTQSGGPSSVHNSQYTGSEIASANARSMYHLAPSMSSTMISVSASNPSRGVPVHHHWNLKNPAISSTSSQQGSSPTCTTSKVSEQGPAYNPLSTVLALTRIPKMLLISSRINNSTSSQSVQPTCHLQNSNNSSHFRPVTFVNPPSLSQPSRNNPVVTGQAGSHAQLR